MRFDAVIERWSREVQLYVPVLPGFQVTGLSEEAVIETASARIDGFLGWLAELGLLPEVTEAATLRVVEVQESIGDAGPLFDLDCSVPNETQVELALAVGRAALSEIVDLVLDEGGSAGPRLEKVLAHLTELEGWYTSRLGVTLPPVGAGGEPIDALVAAASGFEEAVDAHVEGDAPAVWEVVSEEWSLAKVLRRRTAHLREHLPELIAFSQG